MQIKKVEQKTLQIKKAKEQSIKVKNQSIKTATVAGAKVVAEQVEGGDEVQNAALTAYLLTKPIASATKQGAKFARKRADAACDKQIKQKEQQVAKQKRDDGERRDRRSEDRKTSDNKEQFTGKRKSSAKGGSDKGNNKKRKKGIRGLIDKLQMMAYVKQSKHEDGEGKSNRWEMFFIQRIAVPVLAFLLLGMALCALVAILVLAIVAMIYNSPFAIFFPPLESEDTVQSVTSAYISEFHQEVNELAINHTGYDAGRIVYVDYEGTNASPSNYYDVITVYMVKYGMGEAATVMNDTSKGWIETVVDDMCDYSTSSGTEMIQNEDGSETSQSVLYVNVILKDYRDMISVYGFDETQSELLKLMMSPESLAMLGYSEGGGTGQSSVSHAEVNQILSEITNELQKQACSYALDKVGFPYSQEFRDSGDYYDCSSLAYYSWKSAGVDISHGGATTAAAEAQGLDEAGKVVTYEELQPGDLIFYSFCQNGRYKNISHVAICMGNGKVVEAKNESAGVVYGDIPNPERIVLIGRPQ